MHLKEIILSPEKYPTDDMYPFNLDIFKKTKKIEFASPVTYFVGENGSGKSTLLRAIAQKANIHIWEGEKRSRMHYNPYEDKLYRYITPEWSEETVPGSFFASEIFKNFAVILEQWASADPGTINYFAGRSLLEQSHGQCHMSFFKSRFSLKGLYLLDEPENALSPNKQIEFLKLLLEFSRNEKSQFIIATHSPIIMSLPVAEIYSFDGASISEIGYEDTDHYRVYRDFLNNPELFL